MKRTKQKTPFLVTLDKWLESIDLYRKQIPNDESSFFRAVADQVHLTQSSHDKVRQACVEYIQRNQDQFEALLKILEIRDLDSYLKRLSRCEAHGGELEMEAASHVYKVDFLIYSEPLKSPIQVTKNGYLSSISLYQSGGHFDVIVSKRFVDVAGMCQSVLYEMLFERVFQLNRTQEAADAMLHHKAITTYKRKPEESGKNGDSESLDAVSMLAEGVLPFTYKVAKALDPNTYRNVEYDSWISRCIYRSPRTFQNEILQVGSRCIVKWGDNKHYLGYIQELTSEKEPVTVFVETLGQMCVVPYENLKPILLQLLDTKPHPPFLKRVVPRKKTYSSFRSTSRIIVKSTNALPRAPSGHYPLRKSPKVPANAFSLVPSVKDPALDFQERNFVLPSISPSTSPLSNPGPEYPSYASFPFNPYPVTITTLPPPYIDANGDTVIPIEDEEVYPVSMPFCYWPYVEPTEAPMVTAFSYENFDPVSYIPECEPVLWLEPNASYGLSYAEVQTVHQCVYNIGYEFVPITGISPFPMDFNGTGLQNSEVCFPGFVPEMHSQVVETEPEPVSQHCCEPALNIPNLPPRFQRQQSNTHRIRETYEGSPLHYSH